MARSPESSIVTKCALVVDLITDAKRPLTFSEIVTETGFVKSSCHRILSVLRSENMIEFDERERTYTTGTRLKSWARNAWRRADLNQLATTELNRLCDDTQLNVALSVYADDAVLYLNTVDTNPMRLQSRAGDLAPLHCTAAGKVFLAFQEPNALENTLSRLSLEVYTQHTITDADVLRKDICEVHDRGYGKAIYEELLQVLGVAAPILNDQGKVVAAISVWGPTKLTKPEELEAAVPRLLEATAAVSARIGNVQF